MRSKPRLAPVPRELWDEDTAALIDASSAASAGAQALFSTLAHHPKLLRGWMRFAGPLLTRSLLDRRLVELVVLRVAWNCACGYEWGHHVPLAIAAGVTEGELVQVRQEEISSEWEGLDAAALEAADELHEAGRISDGVWARLVAAGMSPPQLIELCMLIGQYEMLSMLIISTGIENEPGLDRL